MANQVVNNLRTSVAASFSRATAPAVGASTVGGVSVSTQALQPSSTVVGLPSRLAVGVASHAMDPVRPINPSSVIPSTTVDISTVAGDSVKPLDNRGFSEQRPVIIATFEFEPAFDAGMVASNDPTQAASVGAVGEMLDIQASLRQLRGEDVLRLVNELGTNAVTKVIIDDIGSRLDQVELDIEHELAFLQQITQKLSLVKRSFTVKFDAARIASDIVVRHPGSTVPADPVRDLFVNTLKFSGASFQSFSDTKLIAQMLEDLRTIIKSFSYSILDDIDPSRSSDVDPFSINRPTDQTLGSRNGFNVASISSTSSGELNGILSQDALSKFIDRVNTFSDPNVKLGAIFTLLSKELRVSSGLSLASVRSSLQGSFGLTPTDISGGIFDRLIGSPGATIFDPPTGGQTAVANLLRVKSGDTTVLPFESTVISRANQAFVPGQGFYVDSIIQGRTKLNTAPLGGYAASLSTAINGLATIIDGTLNVNVANASSLGLSASDIMHDFLAFIRPSIDDILRAVDHDSFTAALLNLAADDVALKHMIVLYVMSAGIIASRQPGAPSDFFSRFIAATDLNAGTGIDRATDPLAGLSHAINAIHTQDQSINSEINVTRTAGSTTNLTLSLLGDIFGQATFGTSAPTSTTLSLANNSLDTLSANIVQRVLDKLGQSKAQSDPSIEAISNEAAFNRLSTGASTNPTFLLRSIVDFIDGLDTLARATGQEGAVDYLSTDEPGLTTFNRIGMHTLVWMVVETFTTFFKLFPVVKLVGKRTQSTKVTSLLKTQGVLVQRNDVLLGNLSHALSQLIVPPDVQTAGLLTQVQAEVQGVFQAFGLTPAPDSQSIINSFIALGTKLDLEDGVVKGIVDVLLGIANGLKSSSDDATRFFDPTGPNSGFIGALLTTPDADDKLAILDPAQVALARNSLLEQQIARQQAAAQLRPSNTDIASTPGISPFIDDSIVPLGVRAALSSMLRSPGMVSPAGDNLRVLSIGLPAGFMAALQRRLSTFIVGQNFADFGRELQVQNDVVRVNVYMRDMLFEDVVFKPMTFTFEVGRFVSAVDFGAVKPDDIRGFDQLVSSAVSTRALSVDGLGFLTETGPDVAAGPSYDAVFPGTDRRQQSIELATNHIKSYLLRVYVKLLTGIDLGEDSYFVNDAVNDLVVDDQTNQEFRALIESHVSNLAGRPVTLPELRASNPDVASLLARLDADTVTSGSIAGVGRVLQDASDAVNVEVSSDLVTFMKAFTPSSTLFGAGARRVRTTSPRLFERVLNVAVDPDGFEVDYDMTVSTTAGRTFIGSALLNSLLEPVSNGVTIDQLKGSLNSLTPVRISKSARAALGNLSLQKLFVTIEQLPEMQPLPISGEGFVLRVSQPSSQPIDTRPVATLAIGQPAAPLSPSRGDASINNVTVAGRLRALGWSSIL